MGIEQMYKSLLQVPHNNATIDTTGAELTDSIRRTGVSTDSADRILVNSLELRVINGLAAKVHLSEHVEGRFFTLVGRTRFGGAIERADQGPA